MLLQNPLIYEKLSKKNLTWRKFNTQIIWCRPCKDENAVTKYPKEFKCGLPLQISSYKLLEPYILSTEFSINLILSDAISITSVLMFMELTTLHNAGEV
jgi:hypothetical protein